MAYIRGAHYIWDDGERVHVWAADGFDQWNDSVWFDGVRREASEREDKAEPSGVAVSLDVADLYVVMRFAELAQQRRVREIVDRAVSTHGENTGCQALRELGLELVRSVKGLTAREEQR
jgi:hypothetical protein